MNSSGPTPATASANTVGPATHEAITSRAQEIWEKLGRPNGRDEEIWLQAERDLQTAQTPAPAPHHDPSAQEAPTPRPTAPAANKDGGFNARPLPPASVASAQPRKGTRGSKAAPR